jgi:hypothetical protein
MTIIQFGFVLSPGHLEYALRDASRASKQRRLNGVADSPGYREYRAMLEKALMSVSGQNPGQTDIHISPVPDTETEPEEFLTTEQVATMLKVSPRHTRRLAPRLGARRVG